MIPFWLTEQNHDGGSALDTRNRQRFISRAVETNARFLRETFFVEASARTNGYLQLLEPRCKLIAFLALIVVASFLRSSLPIWSLYLLTLVLAVTSRIDLGVFLRRVWLAVPLFSLLIILPATLNLVTPGDPLWILCRLGREHYLGPWRLPADIAVTSKGVAVAILFVGRVAVSVSLATLLTLTTPWDRLMTSLRAVKVPALFVITLAMAYRYLFVLMTTVTDLYLARRSRTVRTGVTRQEQQWVAGRIGFVFRKSLQTGSEVHDAMISRGFSSDVFTLSGPPAGWRDYVGVALALLLGLLLVTVDRMTL